MADRKPTLSQNAHPNRTLGRYELIGEIASGGMGSVVLAKLAGVGGFQRLFAIKLLHKQYASDTEFVEMLLDEARIAARIQHPNVVGVQEVSESPDHGYYLVMDYVEGFPLWDIIQHMSVPPPGRWRITNRIVFDALNGLEAAHTLTDDDGTALNVVHRDVSPQNILVSVDGIARVTDFGIAKAAARITSTRSGQLKGKLAYMAPEQAKGKKIDARTDLFAMGIVLWETLTLQRLFKRDSEAETYGQVLGGRIPPVREIVPTLPAAVDAVVLKALERDPDKRFNSARDMAQALEQATRAHNLMADAHEVGNFLRNTFATQLASRRAAIRTAATVTTIPPGQHLASLPGGLAVPQLAQERSGDIAAPGQGPPTPSQGSGVQAAPNRAMTAPAPGPGAKPGGPPGPPARPSMGNMPMPGPGPGAPPGPPARPSMAGMPSTSSGAQATRPPGAPPLPGGPPSRPSMGGMPATKPPMPPAPPTASPPGPPPPAPGGPPRPGMNMQPPARPSVGNMQAPAPPPRPAPAPAPPAPAESNEDDWSDAKDTVIFAGDEGHDHDGGLGDDGPTMAMADADAPEELQAAIARAKQQLGEPVVSPAPRPAAGTPAVRPAAGVPSSPSAVQQMPGPGPGPGQNPAGRAPSGTHNVPPWAQAPQGMMQHGPIQQGPINSTGMHGGMGPGPMGQGPMGQGPMGPNGMPGGPPRMGDMTGQLPAQQGMGMMPPQQQGWGMPQGPMGNNPYMEPGTSAIPLVQAARPNATRWIVIALLVIGIGAGAAAVGIGIMRKHQMEAAANAPPGGVVTQPATTGGR